MDQWYIPITIVPGIVLLLISTSQLLVALNNEVKDMIHDPDTAKEMMNRKLHQLKRLSGAMVFLYISVACFIASGLIMAINQTYDMHIDISIYIAMLGIACAFFGLIALIIYSYHGVRIRQDQYHNRL